MLGRLGLDAADPLEEFMNAALDYGRAHTPSLEGFLHTIENSQTEIKRDQDRGEGSVRVGLTALIGNFDLVLVALADQPLIGASDLTELISAFKKRPRGNVVVPVVNGQRGNPILLDDVARTQILSSDTNLACRNLIERQPEMVHIFETSNTRFITDLDTLQDMEQLAQRTGWKLELPKPEVSV